jgi:hypothetical protein
MLSWQKACEKYVEILSSIPIAPSHKCRFLMVKCISKHERTVFLVSVISVGQIGIMCGKIIVMLDVFLVLPNIKRLLIACCSFCMLFDHLIQRDPAQLTFFKLCGLIDPYNLLLTNPSQSLRGYWDCLEVIRLVTCDIQRARWLTIELFIFCFVQVGGTRVFGLSCLSSPVISWQLHSFLLASISAQLNHLILGHSTGLFPAVNSDNFLTWPDHLQSFFF